MDHRHGRPRLVTRRASALYLGAALMLLFALACPRPIDAQQASVPSTLPGTWRHDGDLSRSVRLIDAAFAPSIASLPELIQGFARSRIHDDMPPPERVIVSVEGARVRVSLDSSRAAVIDGPLGGTARTTGVDDGTRVTQRLSGGWLEIRYLGEGSELLQLFSTEPDGAHMHVDYTVTSPRLVAPVRYRLEYVRGS
ncbi:MAG: hypothetical protein J0L92_11290 [Deltaproteobacteria bacterium]|nr:hypothetical protein [Deltaproteobacteria bacterium]